MLVLSCIGPGSLANVSIIRYLFCTTTFLIMFVVEFEVPSKLSIFLVAYVKLSVSWLTMGYLGTLDSDPRHGFLPAPPLQIMCLISVYITRDDGY